MNRTRITATALALTGIVTLSLTGCAGGTSGGSDDETLRIAMGSPGEAQIAVWEGIADDFEAANEDTPREESGELSHFRFHMADIGTEAMEREKQFLLASQEGERLYRIDEALRRLYGDPEGFGTCAHCGRPIGMERLDVVPETTLCSDCQRASEA